MTDAQTTPIFKPNRDKIALHLNTLFGDIPDGYQDGVIEISNLFESDFFPVTSLDKAIDKAVELNAAGQSVYTTGAVLVPNTLELIEKRRQADKEAGIHGKSYRALGEYFYYSNVCWVDMDEMPDTPDAKAEIKEQYNIARPNYYVITSRQTDKDGNRLVSTHLWWILDKPCFDKEQLETVNKGLIQALGGDKGTHNCTRLMKLGGIVAWPKKPGRVTQMTENNNTDWFPTHSINDMAKAYPITTEQGHKIDILNLSAAQNNSSGFSVDDALDMLKHISPDNVYFDWLSVGMALHSANAPFEVWDHWSSTGSKYPGTKALKHKWSGFTQGGGVTLGTLYYHAHSNGYRAADYKPNSISVKPEKTIETIDPETGEIVGEKKTVSISAINIADIDLDNIPPRSWLFGTMAARKYVTMIGASPGAGKSIFTMQLGVCASAGKTFGAHDAKEKNIKTWIYNNEEGEEELRRRLKGIIDHGGFDKSSLGGKFFMNSGEYQSICIARQDLENGGVIHTPDFDALKQEVINKNIDLLIIDPFAETHALRENDNDEIKRVAGLYRQIALDCNCAVILVHHTRKGGSQDSQASEHHGNMDNLRGGGAQLGVVRRVFTLAKMDEKTATSLNISPSVRRWYVRLDDAKTNITAPAESAEWFKFKSVDINNGSGLVESDSVGVLEHKTLEDIAAEEDDYAKEERRTMLERLARIMIKTRVYENSIKGCADALLDDGYGKYKESKLRKFIKESVPKMEKNHPIISEGFECKFDIIENENKANFTKIFLHIKEISCF